jgi:hypothetical protein
MPYQTVIQKGLVQLIWVEKKEVFQTGCSITLQMAQREIIRNQNSSDRLCKTARWTKEKQAYFQQCWNIVERYKQFAKKGLNIDL